LRKRCKTAKVAREMVEKAGVNLGELLELLVNNASAELAEGFLVVGRLPSPDKT
jgi:ferritin-like protein